MELFVVDSNLTPAKTYFCGFFASEVLKSVNFSKKVKIICKKFGKYKIPPYLCTIKQTHTNNLNKKQKFTTMNFQKIAKTAASNLNKKVLTRSNGTFIFTWTASF